MSEYGVEQVKKAAESLDKLVSKVSWLTSDWRTKINLKTLDMNSSSDCILGQLAGDYNKAIDDIDYINWSFDRSAFGGFGAEWRKHLKDNDKFAVGARWVHKVGFDETTIKSSVEVDGVAHYVVRLAGELCLRTAIQLENAFSYEPKIVFKKGQEVRFVRQDSTVRFYYLSDSRILRIYGVGNITYSTLNYYKEQYGEPSVGDLSIDYILSDIIAKA